MPTSLRLLHNAVHGEPAFKQSGGNRVNGLGKRNKHRSMTAMCGIALLHGVMPASCRCGLHNTSCTAPLCPWATAANVTARTAWSWTGGGMAPAPPHRPRCTAAAHHAPGTSWSHARASAAIKTRQSAAAEACEQEAGGRLCHEASINAKRQGLLICDAERPWPSCIAMDRQFGASE